MLRNVIAKRLLYGEGSGDGLPCAGQRAREIGDSLWMAKVGLGGLVSWRSQTGDGVES